MTTARRIDRRGALSLAGAALFGRCIGVHAQSSPQPSDPQRLPPVSITRHTLELPGRTLTFEATAGPILLTDEKQAPRAEQHVAGRGEIGGVGRAAVTDGHLQTHQTYGDRVDRHRLAG